MESHNPNALLNQGQRRMRGSRFENFCIKGVKVDHRARTPEFQIRKTINFVQIIIPMRATGYTVAYAVEA